MTTFELSDDEAAALVKHLRAVIAALRAILAKLEPPGERPDPLAGAEAGERSMVAARRRRAGRR